MKKILSIAVLFVFAAETHTHEFWMQPEKFFHKVGEELKLDFMVGEDFAGDPWSLKADNLSMFSLLDIKNVQDIKSFAKEGSGTHLTIPLKEAGTKVIVMQSTNASIEREAEKFNAYLKEDGLDDAYAHRTKTNALDKPGKELYTRCAKLLIQVGDTKDDAFKRIAGLPLEIIPERNPYSVKVGDAMKFKILFEGKPVFGARAFVWNNNNGRTFSQPVYSKMDGTIEARISNSGKWMVSVVKMVPSKDPAADWQSYWGSLVFGVM